MALGTNSLFSRRKPPVTGVMLTSMMDMFTIILVFLLYNFSSDQQNFTPPKDTELPYSSSELAFQEAIKVTVSPTDIMVDDKVVAKISRGSVISAKMDGKTILPLYENLLERKKMQARSNNQSIEDDSVILLLADRRVPFHVLDKVLKSAGQAGYPKSRFAVFRRES